MRSTSPSCAPLMRTKHGSFFVGAPKDEECVTGVFSSSNDPTRYDASRCEGAGTRHSASTRSASRGRFVITASTPSEAR